VNSAGKTLNSGSGCIVDVAGEVILTAAHVIKCDAYDCLQDQSIIIMIAPLEDPKHVPRWLWRAAIIDPRQIDEHLDLAALKIVSSMKASPPSGMTPRKECLHKAPIVQQFEIEAIQDEGVRSIPDGVALGSVETVQIGHRLSIWGFPPTGGDTVTMVSCQCDGFQIDAEGNVIAVKVHGSIDNGFSGGPVFDASGAAIGVLSLSIGKVDYCRTIDAARPLIEVAKAPTGPPAYTTTCSI